jgi:transcriptional regulator with XRE-family HTH domain
VNDSAAIGVRVRDVRKRRGLSQEELAGSSGVSVSLIRKMEQGEYGIRLATVRKLADALRVPTTTLMPGDRRSDDADPQMPGAWEPVQRALGGLMPQPEQESTVAGVRDAMRGLAPALGSHRYAELTGLLPGLLRDADALGNEPDARQVRADLLNTTGYLLTQTRQFAIAELTLTRAIDTAGDRFGAAAAADTMLWLYLRQGRLAEARQFAERWADKTEPRFSRATVLELIVWGRFLLNMTNAAVRDNAMGEAEDALLLAGAAAARIGREVRRHENSQCVFGPVSVAYIQAESFVLSSQPGQALSIAASLPALPPYPNLVSRLRHKLDTANAHAMLGDYGEAFTILRGVRMSSPGWLEHQTYARDILGTIVTSAAPSPRTCAIWPTS